MVIFGTLTTTPSASFDRGATGFLTQIKTIKLFNYSATGNAIVSIEYVSGGVTRLYDRYILNAGDAIEISPSFPLDYEGTANGLNIWCSVASAVNCFLQGVENAV